MCARAVGQITRGKTALNRLRQVDVFVGVAYPGVLSSGSPLVVDVGYGAQAWTTLEMAQRWWPANPRARFLGVEIDPERVHAASVHADPPRVDFRLGGFNLRDVLGGEQARLIRCYNVLRQYSEEEVAAALAQMAAVLQPNGLLVEGTCDPLGRMVAFDVYRAGEAGLVHERLVFGTNFREAIGPADFQTILPKRLIHRMLDAEPARFFGDWKRAHELAQGRGLSVPKTRWAAEAHLLRDRFGHPVDTRERIVRRGYLSLGSELRQSAKSA